MVVFLVPRWGANAADAAFVLFWCMAALSLASGWLVPFNMVTRQKHNLDAMTAAWLLPIVPALVAANTAGLVATAVDADRARQLVYMGVILLGFALPLSLAILTLYYGAGLSSLPRSPLLHSPTSTPLAHMTARACAQRGWPCTSCRPGR